MGILTELNKLSSNLETFSAHLKELSETSRPLFPLFKSNPQNQTVKDVAKNIIQDLKNSNITNDLKNIEITDATPKEVRKTFYKFSNLYKNLDVICATVILGNNKGAEYGTQRIMIQVLDQLEQIDRALSLELLNADPEQLKKEALSRCDEPDPTTYIDWESNMERLFKVLNFFKGDQDFVFAIMRRLIVSDPKMVCANLKKFPLTNKDYALQLGVQFNQLESRQRFAKRFAIDPKKMEKSRKAYVEMMKNREKEGFVEGMCLGYTYALIENPAINDDTERKARFIQAAHQVHNTKYNNRFFVNPQKYPELFRWTRDLYYSGKKIPNSEIDTVLFYKTITILVSLMKEHVNGSRNAFSSEQKKEEIMNEIAMVERDVKIRRHTVLDAGQVPSLIKKRIGITKIEPGERHPLSTLFNSLATIEEKTDAFELRLWGKAGEDGHAIYLTLVPPAFCDTNLRNEISDRPYLNTFHTVEEMIQQLRKHLAYTYNGAFTSFELNRIVKK